MRTSGDNDAADSMEQESENRRKGIWKSLLESELKSLSITEKNLSSMVYTNSLNTIAGCYYGLDQYTEAAHYFDLYSKSLRQMLQEKFLLLTDIDRKRVWDEQQQHIDDYRFNVAALPTSVTDLMHLYVPVLYDLELISKGIMLNSVIEFEKVLEQNGNKELIQIYKTIKENQQKIDKLESTVSEENLQKVLALKQTNASLQQKLMTSCAAYSDYTKYLSYTWRDIQAKLGKNDIAIEFTTVPLSPLDKDNYILALILSSTGEPTMSVISTRAILKNMKEKEDLYANRQYYDMIWGFMQEHLTGKQRVYFAPDNNLSDIAIEYLNDGQQTFFEKYEVYRLSSTKELCRDYSETTCEKSITIFGDIDYNTELVAAKRGGTLSFGKLKYGREEIDGIKSFVAKSYKTNVYDGKKATEKLFRELSNKNPMILHISSHGEYNGDDKINETDAMENSLLALSGANADSDDILNDGIITAADIAQMNLRQCDMAVLSACNTGIGGKGTDGIFGLQRGFKNAGVHSLLMSLKPVYDESTAKLMIAFYQGLAQGKSKRQSLLDAQKRGYAESNPDADILGTDAARKITILSALVSEGLVNVSDVHTEGITKIRKEDVQNAEKLGMKIKLLGRCISGEGGAHIMVAPFMISADEPLAGVSGVYNAVEVLGDPIDRLMFYGPGAGAGPTASAVVGDLMQIMRSGTNIKSPVMKKGAMPLPFDSFRCRSYIAAEGVSLEVIESVFGKVQLISDNGEFTFLTGEMCEAECEERLDTIIHQNGTVKSRIRLL
jgi:CHAT domain-containing protein